MKNNSHYLYLSFLIIFCITIAYATKDDDTIPCVPQSHSALIAKPIAQNVVLELSMSNYFWYHADQSECTPKIMADLIPFCFISMNSESLAKYLLPNGVKQLSIAENNSSDISAPWLHINTPDKSFSSCLRIEPQRIEAGIAANLFCRIKNIFCLHNDWSYRLWITAFVPFEWVQHNLMIDESNVSNTMPTPFPNATAAFNNPAWNFGTLSHKPLTRSGIADIYLRLGYDFLLDELNHCALYVCGFIPTSSGLQSHYLFEPTMGNIGHGGLGFGLNGDWCVRHTRKTIINWITDIRYAYFFERQETRSFDLLFNEDWSRYLLVATTNNLESPLPGINFFTQCLSIKPQSTANVWTALHVTKKQDHVEFGYNFWWRQQESADNFSAPDVVIFDITGTPGSRTSASTATIQTGESGPGAPLSDPIPVAVTTADIDRESPIIPNLFMSSFYSSYGKLYYYQDHAMLATVGLYYDWSHNRASFNGFGAWLRASVAF